jgi:hypothetical protein
VSQLSRKRESLDVSQLYGSSRPVAGLALPFAFLLAYRPPIFKIKITAKRMSPGRYTCRGVKGKVVPVLN